MALGLVLLALRLALPAVVAPRVAARLSRALGTRVDIGDLSFQPIDAIFTLRDVTVHAPAQSGAAASSLQPIVAERVRVDVQWLPLLHQTFAVRELTLESARVELDRFPDGTFGLANLEQADPSRGLPAGWSFALDRIAVRNSRLRVRDPAAGGAALFETTLRHADISGMRRRATAFGNVPNLRVDALVGGGRVRVRGRYARRDDALVLDAVVRLKGVPLEHASSYVAHRGWTDLAGRVSGQLRWRHDPRRRDVLSGRVLVRHGSVQVAGLAAPALEARYVVADNASIDLLERRIAVESLTLRGATLALRPDPIAPIPLIAAAPSLAPGADRHATTGKTTAMPRWSWMIERLHTKAGRVRILASQQSFELRAQASGENLGTDTYWAPLRIAIAGEEVAAAFDGSARFAEGVTMEGRLTAEGMEFSDLARAAGLPWADFVQGGRGAADLTVQLDTAADDAPLYARGAVSLTDCWISGPDPTAFAAGAAQIDLTLEAGALRDASHDRSGGRPARIRFSHANVSAPFAFVARTASGWMVPPSALAAEQPGLDAARIVFEQVRASAGTLTVIDLVPQPPAVWEITRLDGSASGVTLPAFTFEALEMRGSDRRFGRLMLAAGRRADTNGFVLSGDGVWLAATAPYLNLARLPYRFAAGKGSFIARGSIHGASWSAETTLDLEAPQLVASDASLEQSLGMPVESALALLRDPSGHVTFDVALASRGADGGQTYADRVAAGVLRAIGRVTDTPDSTAAAAFVPVGIPFPPGKAKLTAQAARELDPIAERLASDAHLIAEITAEPSAADRRWLGEQALYPQLLQESPGGFRGVLRALGMRDARARIQSALVARAHGAPGVLAPGDEALLTRMLATAPPVDEERLAALREARVRQVVDHLTLQYGIGAERIVVRGAGPEETAMPPAVRVQVGVAAEPVIVGPEPPAVPQAVGAGDAPPERLD